VKEFRVATTFTGAVPHHIDYDDDYDNDNDSDPCSAGDVDNHVSSVLRQSLASR
jgi:hypothetical protein